MTQVAASTGNSVPYAEPSASGLAGFELLTELEAASYHQYQIDAGSSSEWEASPSATSYRDCPEID